VAPTGKGVYLGVNASLTTGLLISASGAGGFTGGFGINGVSPIAKPTVTGSRGGNAALASLLTALASYGFITDSTT
jgi:hypothetical protein